MKQSKAFLNICFNSGDNYEEKILDFSILREAVLDLVQSDVPLSAEVLIVEPDEIQKLNRETRNIDSVTDVLSYPTLDGIRGKELLKKSFAYDVDEEGNLFIGSIVICLERAKEQAEEYGHSLKRELYYLAVHGILHLLGYDHMIEEDKFQMRELEERILNRLNITRN